MSISVPNPAFDLYELVILNWNGKQIPTRITLRYYNVDEEVWLYGVGGRERLFSETLIESRVTVSID